MKLLFKYNSHKQGIVYKWQEHIDIVCVRLELSSQKRKQNQLCYEGINVIKRE